MTNNTIGYIALGANLGNRIVTLQTAVAHLGKVPHVTVTQTSPVYEVPAHTLPNTDSQPPYLNAVVEVRTSLAAIDLLTECHAIEQEAGRLRRTRWMARTLDLDLLALGQKTQEDPLLSLPHPRLGARRFVLQPWTDLAPNFHIPTPFNATVEALLDRCVDNSMPRRTPLQLPVIATSTS